MNNRLRWRFSCFAARSAIRSLVVAGLMVWAPTALDAQASRPGGAKPEALVELTRAWIVAAGWLAEARDTTGTEDASGSPIVQVMAVMTANRAAKVKLQRALHSLPDAASCQTGSIARDALDAYRSVIQSLSKGLDAQLEITEKLVVAQDRKSLARLMAASAELQAQMDEAAKTIPTVTVLLTYALLDQEKLTNGTVQHLILSTVQRRGLLEFLSGRFPDVPIKLQAGQPAIEASMSVLKGILGGSHRSSDDR